MHWGSPQIRLSTENAENRRIERMQANKVRNLSCGGPLDCFEGT